MKLDSDFSVHKEYKVNDDISCSCTVTEPFCLLENIPSRFSFLFREKNGRCRKCCSKSNSETFFKIKKFGGSTRNFSAASNISSSVVLEKENPSVQKIHFTPRKNFQRIIFELQIFWKTKCSCNEHQESDLFAPTRGRQNLLKRHQHPRAPASYFC